MIVHVELKDQYELEGKFYEPNGEFRAPKKGDTFLSSDGAVTVAYTDFQEYKFRFILRAVRRKREIRLCTGIVGGKRQELVWINDNSVDPFRDSNGMCLQLRRIAEIQWETPEYFE